MSVIPEAGPAVVGLNRACEILGISRSKGYALHKRGEFPVRTITIGATAKVPLVLLEQFLVGEQRVSTDESPTPRVVSHEGSGTSEGEAA